MEEATDQEQLPKTIIRRLVKDKLGQTILHKDALLAFSEASRVFIHYLSATANDICKESRRQIMSADDVLNALREIDFPELVDPLNASLQVYRDIHAGKREATASKDTASAKISKNSASETTSKRMKTTNVSNVKNKTSEAVSAGNSEKKVPNGSEVKSKDKSSKFNDGDSTSKKAKIK